MPAIVPDDAEKRVVDVIHDKLIPALPELVGYTVGTVVPAGVTPKNFVQVRTIGGTDAAVVADRVRVDVRVWADGTIATEAARSRTARTLLGHLRKFLPCKVFASPIALPDPADNTKNLTLFTIEVLLRGTQQS